LYVDFGDQEIVTQAASADIPIELYLAQRLEAQVRRRRAELRPVAPPANVDGLLDLTVLSDEDTQKPHFFQPLSDLLQRPRWTRELANEFVDQVLVRLQRIPSWWVIIFDHCEKTPTEAQEFVRRLVERAAGTPSTAGEADKGPLRIVLLGDSNALLPNPVYQNHLLGEDLGTQSFGVSQVKEYFDILSRCRGIKLDEGHLQMLADESITRAQELVNTANEAPPPWPCALAVAVIEKTLVLEALAAHKRSEQ
jgi:hypothetical protein